MLLSDPDEFDPSILTLKRNQSESFQKSASSKGNDIREDKIQKQENKEEKKADGELDKKSYEEDMVKTAKGE